MINFYFFLAVEEEPDWCAIVAAETGCKTANAYKKCPEACDAGIYPWGFPISDIFDAFSHHVYRT